MVRHKRSGIRTWHTLGGELARTECTRHATSTATLPTRDTCRPTARCPSVPAGALHGGGARARCVDRSVGPSPRAETVPNSVRDGPSRTWPGDPARSCRCLCRRFERRCDRSSVDSRAVLSSCGGRGRRVCQWPRPGPSMQRRGEQKERGATGESEWKHIQSRCRCERAASFSGVFAHVGGATADRGASRHLLRLGLLPSPHDPHVVENTANHSDSARCAVPQGAARARHKTACRRSAWAATVALEGPAAPPPASKATCVP